MNHELSAALRTHASGLYCLEAAAELIIGHRTLLHRSDFTDFIITDFSIIDDTEIASIDWHAAISALDTGELPCSSGEQRILRLAASLADGIPVSLRDTLIGLDDRNIKLVITAVLHTSGRRPSSTTQDHDL
jgi:hypothetical protein